MVGEVGWHSPAGSAGNYTADTVLTTCAANSIGWYF